MTGRAAKAKEKDLEKWLQGLDGMERLVEDYGGKIPLWEKIMDRQGSVCCVWEKTAFLSLCSTAPQSGQRSGSASLSKQ